MKYIEDYNLIKTGEYVLFYQTNAKWGNVMMGTWVAPDDFANVSKQYPEIKCIVNYEANKHARDGDVAFAVCDMDCQEIPVYDTDHIYKLDKDEILQYILPLSL